MKLIRLSALDELKNSGKGLPAAIAWAAGSIEREAELTPQAVYSAKDVSALLDYFYQLMKKEPQAGGAVRDSQN